MEPTPMEPIEYEVTWGTDAWGTDPLNALMGVLELFLDPANTRDFWTFYVINRTNGDEVEIDAYPIIRKMLGLGEEKE